MKLPDIKVTLDLQAFKDLEQAVDAMLARMQAAFDAARSDQDVQPYEGQEAHDKMRAGRNEAHAHLDLAHSVIARLEREIEAACLREKDARQTTAEWAQAHHEVKQECEALRRKDAETSLLHDKLAHAEQQVADLRWLIDRVKDPA